MSAGASGAEPPQDDVEARFRAIMAAEFGEDPQEPTGGARASAGDRSPRPASSADRKSVV